MDDEQGSRQELLSELRVLRTRLAHFERIGEGELLRVRPMLEQVPAYLWTADHDLRLMWSRPTYTTIVGFDAEPDLGTTVYDLFSGNDDHPSIQAHRASPSSAARCAWLEG